MAAPPAPDETAIDEAPDAALAYDSEGVDRSLVRWMLRLSPTQRLEYAQGVIDLACSARTSADGDH